MMTRYRWMVILALAVMPLSLWGADLPGQAATTGYMHARCWKANPGKTSEMREFFNTVGRTIAEEAVKAGKITAYSVIEARVPRGSEAMCDFIATSRYATYPESLVSMTDGARKRLKTKDGEVGATLNGLGRLVRTTLSRVVGSAGMGKEGATVTVQTFDAPSRSAYEKMASEIQSLAQARIDAGEMMAWGTAVVLHPRGSSQEFNASAYSVFEDMTAQGKNPNWEAHYAKAQPGKSWDDFVSRIQETRERVDSGVYVARVLVTAP